MTNIVKIIVAGLLCLSVCACNNEDIELRGKGYMLSESRDTVSIVLETSFVLTPVGYNIHPILRHNTGSLDNSGRFDGCDIYSDTLQIPKGQKWELLDIYALIEPVGDDYHDVSTPFNLYISEIGATASEAIGDFYFPNPPSKDRKDQDWDNNRLRDKLNEFTSDNKYIFKFSLRDKFIPALHYRLSFKAVFKSNKKIHNTFFKHPDYDKESQLDSYNHHINHQLENSIDGNGSFCFPAPGVFETYGRFVQTDTFTIPEGEVWNMHQVESSFKIYKDRGYKKPLQDADIKDGILSVYNVIDGTNTDFMEFSANGDRTVTDPCLFMNDKNPIIDFQPGKYVIRYRPNTPELYSYRQYYLKGGLDVVFKNVSQ